MQFCALPLTLDHGRCGLGEIGMLAYPTYDRSAALAFSHHVPRALAHLTACDSGAGPLISPQYFVRFALPV